jgi:hypothetical protein
VGLLFSDQRQLLYEAPPRFRKVMAFMAGIASEPPHAGMIGLHCYRGNVPVGNGIKATAPMMPKLIQLRATPLWCARVQTLRFVIGFRPVEDAL